MFAGSDSTFPSGDLNDRSSTGIRGPYPIPVDDDERDIDVADSIIVELEDGFSFFRRPISDATEHYEAFTHGRPAITTCEDLQRIWLVEHGEI